MKIIFLGTPEIAVPSLEYLVNKEDVEVCAVVTQPDKPAGRGHKLTPSPVKQLAEKYNLPIFQPKSIRKESDVIEALKSFQPDVMITVAFGQILSQEVIDIPRLGVINLHASLLPKYRGANPIQWPIINGDAETGVCTMMTEIGVDTGPVLLCHKIQITENMDSLELYNKIAEAGPALLYKSITGLNDGSITPQPQDDAAATHAPKLKKEDGLIDWNSSSQTIHNQIKGMKPWPSAYTFYNGNVLKILESQLVSAETANDEETGKVVGTKGNAIQVKTADGVILILKLQPAGKKAMDASSWYNGIKNSSTSIAFTNTDGGI